MNIPIGLRSRDNLGRITNQSVAVDASNNPVGLQVLSGNTSALVGDDVTLSSGGRLTAAEGRIELGGLSGAGTVGLETNGNTFRLNFPSNNLLSNVTLADDARVSVQGNGGGIAVNTNIFTATNGGRLVEFELPTGNSPSATVHSSSTTPLSNNLSQPKDGSSTTKVRLFSPHTIPQILYRNALGKNLLVVLSVDFSL